MRLFRTFYSTQSEVLISLLIRANEIDSIEIRPYTCTIKQKVQSQYVAVIKIIDIYRISLASYHCTHTHQFIDSLGDFRFIFAL